MFSERLTARTLEHRTRLCLGLDPRFEFYPDFAQLRAHTLEVLEVCAPFIACVKPQLAFFEALGLEGFTLLAELVGVAKALELPIILDAKRGDIGSTAEAYAAAWLSGDHAGCALTVNPYLGFETLTPFVRAARANGGAIFVLVKTSNPGSADLQDLELENGNSIGNTVAEKVALELARLSAEEPGPLSSVGAVVGATHPAQLEHFRTLMPRSPLLLPGLGAQGAALESLAPAFFPNGTGAVVSASRGIQYADSLNVEAARAAALGFRDALNTLF